MKKHKGKWAFLHQLQPKYKKTSFVGLIPIFIFLGMIALIAQPLKFVAVIFTAIAGIFILKKFDRPQK